MNRRIRFVFSVVMIFCSCFVASGCGLFREPQEPLTVEDWMSQPRVNTTKAADKYALKSSKSKAGW